MLQSTRAITWMFAALNTVEPPILDREIATLVEHDKTWYEERLPILEDRVRVRLVELSGRLGDADWLYAARGEARPAYKCAFDDQLAVFTGKPPTG
jgi:glutathione S-transferase